MSRDIVEVYCPLEICRQRNIARGDRYETQSAEQHAMMTEGIEYSAHADTCVYASEECAQQIMDALF